MATYLLFTVGLFDHPFVDETLKLSKQDLAAHRSLARKIATESVILLKNKDSLLPDMGSHFMQVE